MFGLVLLVLACSLVFAVQGTVKLKVLGRAPLSNPVLDAETARQSIKDNLEEIRRLQGDDFILDLADQLDQATFNEENILVGEWMQWMLFRDKAKRVRNIKQVEWAGDAPFKAFGFEIAHAGKFYHLIVAEKCGNIALYYTRGPAQSYNLPEVPLPAKANIPPAISVPAPAPIPPVAIKHHDNFKLKFGYVKDELAVLGPEFKLNEERTLRSYMPVSSYFYVCPNDDSGWLYSTERSLDFGRGSRLWLNKSRLGSVSQSGRSFNLGLELRLWKNLWFSADYFQSRKTKMDFQETLEDLELKMVDYLGYYPISNTHVHYLKFCRRIINHEASVTATTREVNLTLKWLLQAGPFSLAPVVGVSARELNQEIKDDYYISFLYPWQDKVVSLSEVHGKDKLRRYDYTVVAGLSGELRILKPVAVGVDVWYRKFSDHSSHFDSLFGGDWEVHSNPWRVTVSLKLVI